MFSHSTVFTQRATDTWLMPIERGNGTSTAGTYLIQGTAIGHGRAYSTVLTLSLVDGRTVDVDVLVTRNGQIQEMVKVPAGIRAVRFNPASNPSPATEISVSLRRLLWPEYRFRQLRRVVPVLFRQTQQRRARAGLTLRTLFTNLTYAYAVSCRFRANAYMRSYADWHAEFYSVSPEDRHLMQKHLRHWRQPPHFQVIILGFENEDGDSVIETSLDQQIYPHFSRVRLPSKNWERKLVELSIASSQHVDAVSADDRDYGSDWTIILRNKTRLSAAALYWLAHTIDSAGTHQLGVVYADHDMLGNDGRLANPAFKPDWSSELLRATNYIGEAFAWRTRSLAGMWDAVQAATLSQDGAIHSLLLALTADTPEVGHVCAPLWHLDSEYVQSDPTGGVETCRIVTDHLAHKGVGATVTADGEGRCHVSYALPEPLPLVTIVIPTRDGLAHLQRCVDSLLAKTSYSAYEIIVIDNQSAQLETLSFLQSISRIPNIQVLPFNEPFNYSKINNYAVKHARGDLVCLLNNDTEIISPNWLAEMVGLVLQQGVGAVGAKLLYGDDTVQHGGDTVGPGGCANHLHTGISKDEPGYCGRAVVAQDLSAVTAACLLTHKSVYESLGGLNETHLTVAFNDVDFCLRVRDAGLRVLWTPHALLYHHESITRGKDTSPAQMLRARSEVEYMRTRWAHVMNHDPFYNPNLNYQHPDFGLSGMPHVTLPWDTK